MVSDLQYQEEMQIQGMQQEVQEIKERELDLEKELEVMDKKLLSKEIMI